MMDGWACDRIARSTKHFLEVLDELNRLNVEFINLLRLETKPWLEKAALSQPLPAPTFRPRKCFSTYQHLCGRLPRGVQAMIYKGLIGGPDRDRTDDLFHAME
jgi:hypothetical protein